MNLKMTKYGFFAIAAIVALALSALTSMYGSNASAFGPCVDPDGDGWGWDGVGSCKMGGDTTNNTNNNETPSNNETPTQGAGPCVDPDGDGWGWDGVGSCKMGGDTTNNTNTENTASVTAGVTDVILVAGQSNAVSHDTAFNAQLDGSDDRIIVWLPEQNTWGKANLCTQIWYSGTWFPSKQGACNNNIGFQIAKGIIENDSSRKVALIPTGSPGQSITHWDPGQGGFNDVTRITENAIAQLPTNNRSVDMIAWLQGEADHGRSGWYAGKLANLIDRFQSQGWFGGGIFVGATHAFQPQGSVNGVTRSLCTDGDGRTNCVEGEGLPMKDLAHYNASSLRILGDRFADVFTSLR